MMSNKITNSDSYFGCCVMERSMSKSAVGGEGAVAVLIGSGGRSRRRARLLPRKAPVPDAKPFWETTPPYWAEPVQFPLPACQTALTVCHVQQTLSRELSWCLLSYKWHMTTHNERPSRLEPRYL